MFKTTQSNYDQRNTRRMNGDKWVSENQYNDRNNGNEFHTSIIPQIEENCKARRTRIKPQ